MIRSLFAVPALSVLMCSAPLAADVIHVPADLPDIKAALNAATDGDEIIVADGLYTGDGNRNLDFNGKALTLRSANGAAGCIIDCESLARAFRFQPGESSSSVLAGFTIRNGLATNGGAIRCDSSSPMIRDSVFERCVAASAAFHGGGAIACIWTSSPTIVDCTFVENSIVAIGLSGSAIGGAIMNAESSSPLILNCTFEGNFTSESNAAGGALANFNGSNPTMIGSSFLGNFAWLGGAIYTEEYCNPHISDCTFTGNTGTTGGAIFNEGGSLTLSRCEFSRNQASSGGGVGNAGGYSKTVGSMVLSNCSFLANEAITMGGGVFNDGHAIALLSNCVFASNSSSGREGIGGAVASCIGASLTAVNCTMVGNWATSGGGAVCSFSGASATLMNCILWENFASLGSQVAMVYSDPAQATISSCTVQGGEAAVYVEQGSTLNWGAGNIDADPLFVRAPSPGPDAEWGTLDDDEGDLHPQPGSPCIDAGDNTSAPADALDLDGDGDTAELLPIDYDGGPRFVDDPLTTDTGAPNPDHPALAIVDMGAFEFQPPFDPADLDDDGDVDGFDLALLLGQWTGAASYSPCPPLAPADLNSDCKVNGFDLALLLGAWG